MKDNKLKKLLKKEVNSLIPNNYNEIKAQVVNFEQTKKLNNINIVNEKNYSKHKKTMGLIACCMLIIVAVIGVSLPIVLSKNRQNDTLLKDTPQIEQEENKDTEEDSLKMN